MKIKEEFKHLFAFITPQGHFEYNVRPFGFVNVPPCFQRAIDRALDSLKDNVAFVYVDDILCPGKTIDEANENLSKVLKALAKGGFTINYHRFFKEEIEYLGLIIEN